MDLGDTTWYDHWCEVFYVILICKMDAKNPTVRERLSVQKGQAPAAPAEPLGMRPSSHTAQLRTRWAFFT